MLEIVKYFRELIIDSAAKSNYNKLKAEQTCLSKSRIARRGA
ncbi:hypothetical protein SYNTR_0197 [Candidatus Syntrophocurvum alkaliphilum]|uniref:Uncharacterized protein n=1 Tax=Candidatus Syntrophocurvum alkaliphilum TaxID=2293317 RepID=A0A6I6DCB0_9FIRM|nr:hypothetical protein [Candidatus Syntrophocurvum alkaliphilum]QGT98790.1 hypothetical protein SYNTR_0197 [Candidatus Syntrophocurvum alkaliphilum]